jgi:hypothetical protein
MADSTIDSELFRLFNHWSRPQAQVRQPHDSLIDSSHHNVASPKADVGCTLQLKCLGVTGQVGWSEVTYLQVGTQNPAAAIAAKAVCVPDATAYHHRVTNDPDDCILATGSPLVAIALSAMTDLYYGWFWTGGVCPEQYVSGLGGDYLTDDNVVAGPITAHNLDADAIGLGPAAAGEGICGFAYSADA